MSNSIINTFPSLTESISFAAPQMCHIIVDSCARPSGVQCALRVPARGLGEDQSAGVVCSINHGYLSIIDTDSAIIVRGAGLGVRTAVPRHS